ncbi:hypothetical protein [Mycobacterium sp. E3198]|uniref:hypothetical protein n=1 Tax=Mycobacterium sp. E3198 TaxID=1834143 RepID=UPI000801F7F2|nr:hypothetical protein [Mycobacterium sp. E3198]OBG25422.1 hypothetical protein A5673_09045 [Mycobacterium sp. E3198]
MTATVISAIGVIVVALIVVSTSRREATDKRMRLLKELEIIEKLDNASPEYRASGSTTADCEG